MQEINPNENTKNFERKHPSLDYLFDNHESLRKASKFTIWVSIEIEDCFGDAWQEVYDAWSRKPPKQWNELSDDGKFAYTLRAIYRRGIKILKQHARIPIAALTDDIMNAYVENQNPSPYEKTETADFINKIQSIVPPEDYWLILKLEGEELTSQQVADEEGGVTAQTVRKRKERIFKKIRIYFGIIQDGPEPKEKI